MFEPGCAHDKHRRAPSHRTLLYSCRHGGLMTSGCQCCLAWSRRCMTRLWGSASP
jgi:hypothetical protein